MSVRGGKLQFKGEKNSVGGIKKKKKRIAGTSESKISLEFPQDKIWICVPRPYLATGPIFLFQKRSNFLLTLKIGTGGTVGDSTQIQYQASNLGGSGSNGGAITSQKVSVFVSNSGDLSDYETVVTCIEGPSSVSQVLVATGLVSRSGDAGSLSVSRPVLSSKTKKEDSKAVATPSFVFDKERMKRITLKSGQGEYVGTNAVGEATLDSAISEANEWILMTVPDSHYFQLKNQLTGNLLGIDRSGRVRCDYPDRNSYSKEGDVKPTLNDDEDSEEVNETRFFAMGQTALMEEQAKKEAIELEQELLAAAELGRKKHALRDNRIQGYAFDEEDIARKEVEFDGDEEDRLDESKLTQEELKNLLAVEHKIIDKFQSHSLGRHVYSEEDIQSLKRAKTEGRMREELLDRRVKLKSDKYCK